MIEEELKQDAEKSLDKRLGTYAYIRKQDCYTNYVDGYIDGAEPREKRIKELEKDKQYFSDSLDKQIEATLKLDKENAGLKAQMEKMKCCGNCVVGDKACYVRTQEYVNICPSWKLKEIKEKMNEEYNMEYTREDEYLDRIEKLEERLGYAKEIIEGLMRFCRCFAQHHTEDIRYKEAEQFLSEVEE
jgi:hypothetical protein